MSGFNLSRVLDELKQREPIFHRLELGSSREDLENMTDENFWEVGASGQIYTREFVIASLLERYKDLGDDIWETKDFNCLEISPNNYLLTYTLIQNHHRVTRRATLWRRESQQWKIVYHQGTLVQDNVLGLPIEYQQMPEFFDSHNIHADTEAKNAVIEKLLKEQKVHTVLDLTCGTGSQVFYLTERGYEVVGSDFSPALLVTAREKAIQKKKNITFIDGDMRTLKAGKFDAVITIASAIGHLTKADFSKALNNIRDNLKNGGVYIFDIFNLEAITEEIIDDFKMEIEDTIDGKKMRNSQYSEIDKDHGLLTSHDHYTIFNDNGDTKVSTNTFSLQIYTADELRKILANHGFEVIKQLDTRGETFLPDKSINVLTVARKSGKID